MVRTSFLKLIKAVKVHCFAAKTNAWEEPRDDISFKVFGIAEGLSPEPLKEIMCYLNMVDDNMLM